MKIFFSFLTIFIGYFGFSQTSKTTNDSAKFIKYTRDSLASFTFNGQIPAGDGWKILEKQFADNQFVAWGEYHNSPVLSQLSAYALQKAAGYGFKKWCVEVSPFVAAELMRISKEKDPFGSIQAISKDHPDYGTFPFFKTKEDVEMLTIATKNNYSIWGIDQEFQMAFPYCITQIYNAQSHTVKKRYKGVYDSLLAKWWMPEVKLIDSLKHVTSQKNLRMALDDLKISRTIYYESDNLMRADLMKRNFYRYYDQSKKQEKVFFKMGANHLAKGLNLMTDLYDIGNAVFELSQRNNSGFANVYFINRYYTEKGVVMDDLASEESEYPKEFLQLYDKDKWVVLDIRPLRHKLKNDKTLTADTYSILNKYDIIVVSPEVMK